MFGGEKHIFINSEGDKLDAKMIELGIQWLNARNQTSNFK
jgi:hypothetical protein